MPWFWGGGYGAKGYNDHEYDENYDNYIQIWQQFSMSGRMLWGLK